MCHTATPAPKLDRALRWPMRFVLAAAVLVAFGFSINAQFVGWDDQDLIVKNPNFNPPAVHGLVENWRRPDHQMYIPVVYTAWWTLCAFSFQ